MGNKMKILITQDTDWIRRFPAQQHHLAERLVTRGHEIRVIDYEILWQAKGKKELFSSRQVFNNVSRIFKDTGITVIRPGILKIPILEYVSMLFTYNKEIKRQIEAFKPDVIIGHSILTNYLSMRLSKRRSIPFLFHLTDAQHTIIPSRPLQPIGKIIESINFKNADRVVVINERLKDYAISMGASSSKTHVVRAGIDIERYNCNLDGGRIRERFGINKDDSVLFFMGLLYKFSGLKEVALELAKIKDKIPNIKLLIVGDGDAFEDLKKIQKDYDLENQIILTGRQPYKDVPEFIAASDICLLPAYNNKTMRHIVPIKMYEYMAMEKPVISTKLPGVMKEFGKDHGVIYVDRPEDALMRAIELISSGDIQELGANAKKFVENNSWNSVTNQFEQIMEAMHDG
jgi:glycosyltransferase involved in cell wall biosynthesis